MPTLRKTEVLILNKEEGAKLVHLYGNGTDYPFLLNTLFKLGPQTVVITDGRKGAYAKRKGTKETFHVPTLPVSVKEVTGAGDAFASGFLAAYAKRKTLQECLRWGILNSTSCIQEIGAQNGLLTLRTLQKLYKKHYPV
jgi:ribokinase